MAIEFYDGFDSYTTGNASPTSYISGGYVGITTPDSTTIVTGRFAESNALTFRTITPSGPGAFMYTRKTTTPTFSAAVAFNWFWTGGAKGVDTLLGVSGDVNWTQAALRVAITSDGQLEVRRWLTTTTYTVLARTVERVVIENQWNHIAFYGRMAASGEFHVALNGLELAELSQTGVDTRSAKNLTAPTHYCPGGILGVTGGSTSLQLDDFVVRDDMLQIPDCRVFPLRPNADGGTLNWTPSTGTSHFAMVDEVQVDIADYIQASTPGQIDLLGLQDMPYVPDQILAAGVRGWAAKTDAATRVINLGVQMAGGGVSTGPDFAMTTSPTPMKWFGELNPVTGLAWTKADIDGMFLRPSVKV